MKASENDGRCLAHRLADFLLSYRATPHSTTKQSPSSISKLNTSNSSVSHSPNTESQAIKKPAEQVLQHDQHAKE